MNPDISFETLVVDKKEISGRIELNAQLSKQLSAFLTTNLEYFNSFDKLIIYYDNGQSELTNILVSVFSSIFGNVEFRKAEPFNYRLLQSADLFCTLRLLQIKRDRKELTKSELSFFKNERYLKKQYLTLLKLKRFTFTQL
jgi:hypothetical protein